MKTKYYYFFWYKSFFQNLKKNGIYIIEDSSQYKASKNLNVDNLGYGVKEILLSLKLEDNLKVDYLSQDEAKKMKNKILPISLIIIFLSKSITTK